MDLNGKLRFELLELMLADQLADLPRADLPVDMNGNFRFLLLELIWVDQLADLIPGRSASGSEWQFHISTLRADIAISQIAALRTK